MQHVKQKDGGDGTPFPPGALLRADSHRLLAGESSHCASAQAGGGRPSSMTGFVEDIESWVRYELAPTTGMIADLTLSAICRVDWDAIRKMFEKK